MKQPLLKIWKHIERFTAISVEGTSMGCEECGYEAAA